MKIADLIDWLTDIHNSVDANPEVSIMTETENLQITELVTDVAFSKRNNSVIIIGREVD